MRDVRTWAAAVEHEGTQDVGQRDPQRQEARAACVNDLEAGSGVGPSERPVRPGAAPAAQIIPFLNASPTASCVAIATQPDPGATPVSVHCGE